MDDTPARKHPFSAKPITQRSMDRNGEPASECNARKPVLNGGIRTRSARLAVLALSAASMLAAGPALAQDDIEDTSPKFSDVQKLGYLGRTSKHALTQSVLAQLAAKTAAPDLTTTADRVIFWHDVLLDTIALDHTGSDDFGGLPPFTQGGPGRTSRALAMVTVAMYDAGNAYDEAYEPYLDIHFNFLTRRSSKDAAISAAAHRMLVALFPWHREALDSLLLSDLAQIDDSHGRIFRGALFGNQVALKMLVNRITDRSRNPEPSFGEGGRVADGTTTYRGTTVNDGSTGLFDWTPDPNTPEFDQLNFNVSLGAYWGGVTPFTLNSGDQFRIPPYPSAGSMAYIDAHNEVAALGRSEEQAGSTSTPATRFNGNFWGYDAVPLLGTPPRSYNQYAIGVILQELGCDNPNAIDPGTGMIPANPASCGADAVEILRMLAMVNAAMGDSGIAAWDSKYYYNYWRPVTGVRIDDGVPETQTDPTWDPVGVSIINVELPAGEDFVRPTPPFPAYPSGHATFGAATMNVLASEFGDATPYTHISDEYNGQGVDPSGTPRPLVPVLYDNLSDAQIANGLSRIHNGVHWSYDDFEGQALGENIADWIVNDFDAFKPAN